MKQAYFLLLLHNCVNICRHEKMQTNETMLVFVYVQGGVKKLNNNVFSALSFLASVCVCLEFVHSFFSTPLLSLSLSLGAQLFRS